jgi:KipI family sensor histidine kinase inhibitor
MTAPKHPVDAVRPAGDRGVLLELGGAERVAQVYAELSASPVDGITDLVPGATTLLIVAERAGDPALAVAVRRAQAAGRPAAPATPLREVRLPVRYDGEDLREVADRCGLSTLEVMERHCRPRYSVAFLGLTPGFAYLTGLDPALHLPRRESPRVSVPAGAVAIASDFTGVYPRPSPGGWHLLGTTTTPLWNLAWDPPALLVAGTTVRFAPVQDHD